MRNSLDRLWLLIALALPGLVALLVPLPAVDLAYQVRAGDMILSTGAIPATDTFTFTVAGTPWTDQQWLAQVLLALGFHVGGWELLAVLRAGLIVAASGLLIKVGLLRGASLRTASILSLLAFLISAPALALRPQLFAIVVFTALLVLVAGRDRHPRAFLAAPWLVVLWANLHGSFVLVPLLFGYAFLDDVLNARRARRSFAVLLLSSVATVLTPFGPGVWAYALGIGANPVISDQVSEWQRTSPLTPTGAIFYVATAAVAALAWRGRSRLAAADWLWLGALTLLAVWAVRGVAWWAPGAILVAGAAVRPVPDTLTASLPAPRLLVRANRVFSVLLVAGTVLVLPWWRSPDPLTGRQGLLTYAPSGLAQALRAHAPAGTKVFVPQTWASWFEWAVPEDRYFMDSRFELFPADVWTDNDAAMRGGTAAEAVLDSRGVQVLVVPPSYRPSPATWIEIYGDQFGGVFARAVSS